MGDRMKERYEDRFRIMLPRRTYTILRLDGKAFSSLTRDLNKPYDLKFAECMDATSAYLVDEIQGCRFGYSQSDEISLLLTDFEEDNTDAWFKGNMQKMVSVASAIASTTFTKCFGKVGLFDCRAFQIADPVEVANYFIWRQRDCERNSIQGLAQKYYSHKQLNKKKSSELHEMIHQAGDNWNNWPIRFKRGFVTGYSEIPVFSKDWAFLKAIIPQIRTFEPAESPK